mmetsp:Transcript_46137/g.128566  ORF Transcript_46137/g.128566 Transcript_46137/m.128566 type:complete len:92 (+) Transcript_46137:231-506(+)
MGGSVGAIDGGGIISASGPLPNNLGASAGGGAKLWESAQPSPRHVGSANGGCQPPPAAQMLLGAYGGSEYNGCTGGSAAASAPPGALPAAK